MPMETPMKTSEETAMPEGGQRGSGHLRRAKKKCVKIQGRKMGQEDKMLLRRAKQSERQSCLDHRIVNVMRAGCCWRGRTVGKQKARLFVGASKPGLDRCTSWQRGQCKLKR